jgi:hypothetical protein
MDLFGFLKSKKAVKAVPVKNPMLIELRVPKVNEPALTPQQLREQLFDAAATGDEEKLCTLCQLHEKSIFEQGMIWSRVPEEIRASPTLLKWYANGLKAIARFCADRLGKPELMDQVKEIEALPGPAENEDLKRG